MAASTMDEAPPDEDSQLLARLRQKDAAAFEVLVRSHGGRMMSVALRMMRHETDAQDVVQEAFLSAFKALPQFSGQSRLSTWLHRIVINAALMKLRAKQRKPESSIEDLLPHFKNDGHVADVAADWSASAEEAMLQAETRQFVRQSIDRLPDSYRTVLILRDLEDLSTSETAAILEVSVDLIKTRLHRARQALRTLLEHHFQPV